MREKTNAPILDCKKALIESEGNLDRASQILREKGIAKADKRSDRETKEGLVASYIHPGGKLGVLIQINCESDFVARTDEFVNLAKELSLQIAASAPLWISRDEVPKGVIDTEGNIYAKQAKNEGKPEKVIDKIVEGKMEKFFSQNCLLEQQYVRDPNIKVESLVKDVINKVRENVRITRFARFKIGEQTQ